MIQGELHRMVDQVGARDAHGAARAVNERDRPWKQLVEPEFHDGVRLAAQISMIVHGRVVAAKYFTTPLGNIGGSNGGLLMGVEFTQHPEMWNAVVIQVPLLDMLAYEHLSAGASWVGEYDLFRCQRSAPSLLPSRLTTS